MKRIGLYVKVDDHAIQKADQFEAWLRKRDIDVVRRQSMPPSRRYEDKSTDGAPSDLFCVFVLGGDGTFLSAARWIGEQSIPIIGVKFGTLGFLAEIPEERLFVAAEAVLASVFETRDRMRLDVSVVRNGEEVAREPVLNDIVINKGALARLARIETCIDERYLTNYRADGLIVSTPTGSTAYSLAAGGPIVHPSVPGIIMTPICPFTLTNRPLIVPDASVVKIRLAGDPSDIMLTFDGQVGLAITDRDTIIVRKSSRPVQLIVMPESHYFDLLKNKLGWSGEAM